MNFLAHAYLSFNNDQLLTGNMIADAVKGKDAENYPEEITRGILLHRSIDAFTDQHELVKQTRKIFYPVIKHYSLVISDVIYDHFLGVNWHKYSDETLHNFSIRSYADLDKNIQYIPEKFARIFPYMKEDNWFTMYATRPGIHRTIERLSWRSEAFVWKAETIEIFETNYTELEGHFLEFFPRLIDHSKDFLKNIQRSA
jgi:acyl carrier protein phosphodiesterase